MAATNGCVLRGSFDLSIVNTSWCITIMAVAGAVGSMIPSWLPWSPMQAIRASMAPLALSALCLLLAGALGSDSLFWFMTSICLAELVLYTPFISAVCQFTCNIEDIAGLASSLLSSFVYLGSSLVSLPIVVAAGSGVPVLLSSLAAALTLVGLCLFAGLFGCSLRSLRPQSKCGSEESDSSEATSQSKCDSKEDAESSDVESCE